MARELRVLARNGSAALLLAALALAALPGPAAATVRGGCEVSGTSTSGGPINLTTSAEWHVRSTDRISGSGTAPSPQTYATVRATGLGFPIPLGGGPADPATAASSDTFEISALSVLGKVFLISGYSTGPGPGCDGEVLVIIDDVNPILTVLGGGGLIAVLIGLAGFGWGLRGPGGVLRGGVGIVSLALAGVGGSLALQQTAPSIDAALGATAGTLGHSAFVDSLVAPAKLALDSQFLIQAGILTLLILALLPFPSQLFNSTLEQNYESIKGGFRRVPIVGRFVGQVAAEAGPAAPHPWRRRFGVLLFVLLAGLLYSLLDPGFGPSATSAVTYGGIVIGLVVVTWISAIPNRALHGRLVGDRGYLSALAATLLVAAVCVLISRLVGFLPGYLYGLVFGYSFAKSLEPRQDGHAGVLGAWWLLALSLVAWVTLGAIRIPGVQDTVAGTIALSLLAAIGVAGIEGIVFSLMPLRFLPGEAVFRWHRLRWYVLYGVGLFSFLAILLNPANGYVPAAGATPFPLALGLFIAFGAASILFWGYFRFRPKPRAA
jgi:hypothetical protein